MASGCGSGQGESELNDCGGQACACTSDTECSQGRYCASSSCVSDCEAGRCASGQCDAFGRCMSIIGSGGTSGGLPTPTYSGGIADLDPEEVAALDEAACAGWRAEPEPENAILMLVVDTSGSMDVAPDGQRGDTKWETTEAALSTAIADLPANTAVGMLFYPGRAGVSESSQPREPSTCIDFDEALPIERLGAPNSSHRRVIDEALADVRPRGGTPTHDAYDYALERLRSTQLFGAKNMLLITDGQPTFSQNCIGSGLVSEPVEEQPIVEAVQSAQQSDGIRTFVIGSPGSEFSWTGGDDDAVGEDTRPWLSQAARAGNTAQQPCSDTGEPYCHFDMSVEPNFASGLSAALASVGASIVSCSYDLPVPPSGQTLDRNSVNVILTTGGGETKLVLRDDGTDCTEGWRYTDTGVELCPESCDRVHADAGARLQLLFGCASFGEPPK